jgi:hypothetical protein
MAATAFHALVEIMFGLFRLVTGVGVWGAACYTAAPVSEFAPNGKQNFCNAITYSD